MFRVGILAVVLFLGGLYFRDPDNRRDLFQPSDDRASVGVNQAGPGAGNQLKKSAKHTWDALKQIWRDLNAAQ